MIDNNLHQFPDNEPIPYNLLQDNNNNNNDNIISNNPSNIKEIPMFVQTFSIKTNSSDGGNINSSNTVTLPDKLFPSKTRIIVYILFLISNILISMDHGSIPASTLELRSLTPRDQTIGLFGSLVYVGNIIGSLIFFTLINKYNRKYLLLLSLVSNSICLFTFVISSNIPFLFLNRIVIGIFQAYITIYLPVWCNQFGERSYRTFMIAFVQFGSPIGIFLGYLIASVAIEEQLYAGWKFAFVIQGILILILMVVFLFVPEIYFEQDVYSVTNTYNVEKFVRKSLKSSSPFNQTYNSMSISTMLSIIIKKKIFMYSVIGLSTLIYVITGVQYWISDYMTNILLIPSPKRRLFFFTLVCFTSPTFGLIVGTFTKNILCQNDMTKSLIFCLVLAICASFFAVLVPITSDIFYFLITMWLALFFGGGIAPVITNIIITAVPKKLDASGNSITNLITNLLGYLPAPYVYGILSDIFWDKGIIGMRFTMWYSVVGVFFCAMATYYSIQRDKKKKGLYSV